MLISKNTLTILKNFSSFNSGMLFKPGNKQSSLSINEKLMGEVEFEESFPLEFGVYDLSQFLSNVETLDNPEIVFSEKTVNISDKNFSLTYYACAPNIIKIKPVNKSLPIPDVWNAEFFLDEKIFSKILTLVTTNGFPNFLISGANGKLSLTAIDRNNPTSNSLLFPVGEYTGEDFSVSLPKDSIEKLMKLSYNVKVSDTFTIFENEKLKLKYYLVKEL